jgi:hypothetical protein
LAGDSATGGGHMKRTAGYKNDTIELAKPVPSNALIQVRRALSCVDVFIRFPKKLNCTVDCMARDQYATEQPMGVTDKHRRHFHTGQRDS